tara:strand:- start:60 stop:494 length:435 start_codon:yes stop_codon:yes gene_type:complete
MRYKGQGWEIPVTLEEKNVRNPKGKELKKLFEKEYKNIFGRIVNDIDIEITIWSVNSFTTMKKLNEIKSVKKTTPIKIQKKRSMFDSKIGKIVKAHVIKRTELTAGDQIFGPAIITEDETTIIISSEFSATVQLDKCIRIEKNN